MRAAHLFIPALLAATPALAQVGPGASSASSAPRTQPSSQGSPSAPAADEGEVEIGARLSSSPETGRFQRFEDLRSGPTLNRLRYARQRDTWAFNARFDNAGYRDQRYVAGFERFGKVQASFEWTQTPLLYGTVTRTPFRQEVDGVFRLDDSVQAAVQNGAATITDYAGEVRQIDLRSRRDTANLRLVYWPRPDVGVSAAFTSSARTGQQPWAASFGFGNATVVPAPVDHRSNQVTTAAEWSTRRGMARIAYDGSWFENGVAALTWDNPLRFTDRTYAQGYVGGDASAQGRMALWPDSTAHTVSASGSVALPARSRAFAYLSVGSWLQDERLLPHTINSAITPIPLPRETAEAEALITSMNYRVTSRPTPTLWLSGQYRLYDFDNRTPHFAVDQYVRLDQTVSTSATGGSEPFGYTRHFVDLDASYTPFRFAAFRLGYGQEHDERTFRLFETTTDRTVRASVDGTGFTWGSVRLQYDRSVRTGDGLDEEVFSDIGEQVSLRQFDIADRTRDRVTAIVQVVPASVLGISASVSAGRENRPDSAFGLQDNDLLAFTAGVDYSPADAVTAGISYSIENYSTLQRSRQANPGPQFDDPTRDWSTDMDEDVHTVSTSIELPRLAPRTSARVAYDRVHSNARYRYQVPANSTLATPQQLPAVRNVFDLATADVRYTFTTRIGLGVGYRFDHYDVDDFALSPGTLNSPLIPGLVNVLYQWRPYRVHTGSVRMILGW